ncbi:MAG: transcription elongation factor GreA [Bacteriovoracia bacterium]
MNEFPMTLLGKKLLETELEQLIRVEREKVKEAIAEARALGDLKENAEYSAAKEKQSHIEGRIGELQAKLARARVVEIKATANHKIVFGATVGLTDANGNELTYQIVGEDEAMTDKHKISYSSPLGKALIGKEAGDEVVVKAPKGDVIYEVQSVDYI